MHASSSPSGWEGELGLEMASILTLGSLIQCFELERVGENKIDMAEKTTVNMSKVEPLELMCRARPILDMLLSLSGQKI